MLPTKPSACQPITEPVQRSSRPRASAESGSGPACRLVGPPGRSAESSALPAITLLPPVTGPRVWPQRLGYTCISAGSGVTFPSLSLTRVTTPALPGERRRTGGGHRGGETVGAQGSSNARPQGHRRHVRYLKSPPFPEFLLSHRKGDAAQVVGPQDLKLRRTDPFKEPMKTMGCLRRK